MDYGDDGSTETSTPTPAPTMVYYVAASISMTGITCDDYGDDEETAVKAGVASIMDGVEVADIGDTTCAGLRRRRALLSAGVSISFTITLRAASESSAASLATTL